MLAYQKSGSSGKSFFHKARGSYEKKLPKKNLNYFLKDFKEFLPKVSSCKFQTSYDYCNTFFSNFMLGQVLIFIFYS